MEVGVSAPYETAETDYIKSAYALAMYNPGEAWGFVVKYIEHSPLRDLSYELAEK